MKIEPLELDTGAEAMVDMTGSCDRAGAEGEADWR